MRALRTAVAVIAPSLLFVAASGCRTSAGENAEAPTVHAFSPEILEPTAERLDTLVVPDGFRIGIVARDLGRPRMLAVHPTGRVYVTRPSRGDVVSFLPREREVTKEIDTAVRLAQVHGIVFENPETVWLATVAEVFKAKVGEDGRFENPERIVAGLPSTGGHHNRTLGFGPDGMLYLTVGSTCNACVEANDENATMLVVDPETGKRRTFARGLRNTIGFDWHPETKRLYGLDHGIDNLGDDEQKEEMNEILDGKHYGWPYVFADRRVNPNMRPHRDSSADFARRTEAPVALYRAHSAPLGLRFYRGTAFPREFRGDAFGTMHGSWNRWPPSGYEIVRIRFRNGEPEKIEPFITGFLAGDGRSTFGRPCGLALHPDGSLFVSDDATGVIYRVSYERPEPTGETKR